MPLNCSLRGRVRLKPDTSIDDVVMATCERVAATRSTQLSDDDLRHIAEALAIDNGEHFVLDGDVLDLSLDMRGAVHAINPTASAVASAIGTFCLDNGGLVFIEHATGQSRLYTVGSTPRAHELAHERFAHLVAAPAAASDTAAPRMRA